MTEEESNGYKANRNLSEVLPEIIYIDNNSIPQMKLIEIREEKIDIN